MEYKHQYLGIYQIDGKTRRLKLWAQNKDHAGALLRVRLGSGVSIIDIIRLQ